MTAPVYHDRIIIDRSQRESAYVTGFSTPCTAAGVEMVSSRAGREILEAMTLNRAPALIATIKAGPWRSADDDTRFQILSIVNAAIVSLRERHKLPPFEDPLPGAPLNAFLVIRELLR